MRSQDRISPVVPLEPATRTDAAPTTIHAPLHRRQFVIGPAAVRPDAGWIVRPIGGSLVLSHSPALPVAAVTDAAGTRWHLLGRAVAAEPGADDPLSELARRSGQPVERLYGRWAGRWTLVGDGAVHTDATALMPCFHRPVPGGSGVWASSSPALIADLPGTRPARVIAPRLLARSRGMDWFPPPASRFAGVSRLLPSQVLRLDDATNSLERRRLLDDRRAGPGYPALLAAIEGMLRATVAAYAGAGADLWLPLTGGIDSRLVLAAAAAEGVRVTTYTFHRPGLAYADAALPPRLATAVGAPHVAIHPGPVHPGRRSLYDVHCAGHSVEVDRELFARGEWDEVPHHALSLRGGVFEAGRCFYHGRLPRRLPDDVDDAHSMLRTLFQFDRFHAGSAAHDDGLARWLAWAAGTPEPGLDWRDRLYLEQTTAGWLGSTAQALDLFACELAYPANSRALLSALLALDEGARCGGDHHRDLIARMAPDLLSLPINPPGPVTARAASLVRREWHDLRAYPGRMTYVRHRLRWIRDRARRARGGL